MIYAYRVNENGRCFLVTGVDASYVAKEDEKLFESEDFKSCYDLSSDAEKAKDDWGTMKP